MLNLSFGFFLLLGDPPFFFFCFFFLTPFQGSFVCSILSHADYKQKVASVVQIMKPSQAKFVILCKLNRIHSGWKFWTAPSGKKNVAFFLSFFTNLFQIIYTSESARIQLYCCCNIMQHHPKCHQGVLYFYWFSCICGNYKNHCHHIKSPELHNRVRMCYKPQHYAAFFGAFKLMDVWLKLRCCIRFSKLS